MKFNSGSTMIEKIQFYWCMISTTDVHFSPQPCPPTPYHISDRRNSLLTECVLLSYSIDCSTASGIPFLVAVPWSSERGHNHMDSYLEGMGDDPVIHKSLRCNRSCKTRDLWCRASSRSKIDPRSANPRRFRRIAALQGSQRNLAVSVCGKQ
jgi:hypothetical protein